MLQHPVNLLSMNNLVAGMAKLKNLNNEPLTHHKCKAISNDVI